VATFEAAPSTAAARTVASDPSSPLPLLPPASIRSRKRCNVRACCSCCASSLLSSSESFSAASHWAKRVASFSSNNGKNCFFVPVGTAGAAAAAAAAGAAGEAAVAAGFVLDLRHHPPVVDTSLKYSRLHMLAGGSCRVGGSANMAAWSASM